MIKRNWKLLLLSLSAATVLVLILFGIWVWTLDQEITDKLRSRRFLPPTEFYTAPLQIREGDLWSAADLRQEFLKRQYTESTPDRPLSPGRFWNLENEACRQVLPDSPDLPNFECLIFSPLETPDPLFSQTEMKLQAVLWEKDAKQVLQTRRGNPLQVSSQAFLEPEMFAQYLGSIPVLQSWTALGETPSTCLNAVLAIEDAKFLDHGGVSFLGIARAFLKNILRGRAAQGGSTITQQMVKNFFLTSEKTFKRKATEIVMSFLLEAHSNKDEIFETYLNIIYMGQSGPFEVRGFGAASQHYFQKPLSQLELHECSLLAAVLNSPGTYDPFRKMEAAQKRRGTVLDRMKELGFIDATQAEQAKERALPQKTSAAVWETAPYYIQAALKEVQDRGLSSEGLRVMTGLRIQDQAAAQKAVQTQIEQLEKQNKKIKSLAEKGTPLEGVLLSMDLTTSWVTAAVGGRSYRKTQYNRILEGHRQVGSLMKPFVYYTALEQNPSLNALSMVNDEPQTYKYEGQSWTPENYGKKYFGEVPFYFALKNSLNAATAKIGMEAGLSNLVANTKKAGATSPLKALPSLTLGAFELYPTEVLQIYSTLARMGQKQKPIWVRSALTPDGQSAFQASDEIEAALSPLQSAEVISMMKQTVRTGTAQTIAKSGYLRPAAGKTGTTSDSRDAWFAGFTPRRLTLAWLGYDQVETHGLTGASGPVPIWLEFMKTTTAREAEVDFSWPEGTRVEKIKPALEETEIELVLPQN